MSVEKVTNNTRSRMKTTFPIVLRPWKVYGCSDRSVAKAFVDIVHSNHDHVKCATRSFHETMWPS